MLADYVGRAADQLDRFSARLGESDVNALIEDAKQFVHRRPAVFVGAAFATGIVAARFLKSSVVTSPRAPRTRQLGHLGEARVTEQATKPFMTEMAFRGDQVLLDEDRQLATVRWAVKTAMVYQFTSPDTEHKYFTAEERRAFKERFTISAGVWIWIARYDGVKPQHAVQSAPPALRRGTRGVDVLAAREDHG